MVLTECYHAKSQVRYQDQSYESRKREKVSLSSRWLSSQSFCTSLLILAWR